MKFDSLKKIYSSKKKITPENLKQHKKKKKKKKAKIGVTHP
jgi:hypothetical protein